MADQERKKLNITIERAKGKGFKVYDQADGKEISNVGMLMDDGEGGGTVVDVELHRHHAEVMLKLIILGEAMDHLYVDPSIEEAHPQGQPDVVEDPIAEEVGARVLVMFNTLLDLHPGYLETQDYELAEAIYKASGQRVPREITDYLMSK